MESNKLNEDVTENRKNFKFEIKRKNSTIK